jgi:hypothetical protein
MPNPARNAKTSKTRAQCTTILILAFAACFFVWGSSLRAEEPPLTNADVIALHKAGLSEQNIMMKIQQAPREALDVSTSALLVLMENGLTKDVVAAIQTRVAQRTPPPPTAAPAPVQQTPGGTKVTGQKANGDPGSKPCLANFTSKGGYWSGEKFQSFQEYQGVDKGKAFTNVLQSVLSLENMVVTSSSKETGTISGHGTFTPVLGGSPRPAPLGVTFKDLPNGGFRIDIQFNVPSGCVAQKKAVQEVFCTLLESALQ